MGTDASLRHILIVEDDVGLSLLVKKQLERQGWVTARASSGGAALDYVRQNPNILMLLDYQLGDMKATELVSCLSTEGFHIPFVVMTGQGSETVAVETMKMGARDYVVKNTTFLELLPRVVGQVMDELGLEDRLTTVEEALRKEKTHLLNNIPDMVFQVDNEGRFTSVNPATAHILGYREEEILGRLICDFLHRDDVPNVKRDHEAVKHGQQILRHPVRFIHRDGSVRWLEGNIVAMYHENRPVGISAIYQDITDTKAAADELREAEERIRLMADTVPSLMLELDIQNRIVSMNRAARWFLGCDNHADLGDTSFEALFDNPWQDSVSRALSSAKKGNSNRITAELSNARGLSRWYDIVFSPLRNTQGDVIRIIATAWDVSDRVDREERIRESLEREARYAEEATILQNVSVAAGSGVHIDPTNVIRAATTSVHAYLRSHAAIGYLLDDNHVPEMVCHVGTQGETFAKELQIFLRSDRVVEAIRNLRIPKRLSGLLVEGQPPAQTHPEHANAALIIPLVNASTCYGFLVLEGISPQHTRMYMRFLRSLISCAGLAIANAQMFRSASERLKNRMMQVEGFGTRSILSSANSNRQDVLETLAESSVGLARARGALLLIYNEGRNCLEGVAGTGLTRSEVSSTVISSHECVTWRCIRDKKPLYCEDIARRLEYIDDTLSSLAEKSLLCIPLFEQEDLIGVLAILDPLLELETGQTRVLDSFAQLVVQSVTNSVLAERALELDRTLARIRQISRTITSTHNINLVLREICHGVVESLQAEAVFIARIARDSNDLRIVAHDSSESLFHRIGAASLASIPLETPNLLTKAISSGEPVICSMTDSRPHLPDPLAGIDARGCCAIPIGSKEHTEGVMLVFHSRPDACNTQNLTLLEEFCDQAALAMSTGDLKRTLHESETLRNIIIQSVNEALVVVDWTGSILTANAAAERLFGRKANELKNTYYTDVLGKANPIVDVTAAWLDSRQHSSQEGWIRLDQQPRAFVEVRSQTVMIEDVPCLLLTILDQTTQKQMNASLEQADKLTTAGRIATQIAHEIGNPMTLISSQIQRMVSQGQVDPDRLKGLLSHVDRITELIRRFSDLERKSHLSQSQEAIEPIIDNVLGLVTHSTPFRGIEIVKEVEPGVPQIDIDKNMITQLLLNLLLNAADACDPSGQIRIHLYKTTVSMETHHGPKKADFVVLAITDSGCGIPKEQLKDIFEPFYTTKESGKGTGLGLSVSLSIVDQHHGWINVESEVGTGSTFKVYLPVQAAGFDSSEMRIREVDYRNAKKTQRKRVRTEE